MNHDEALQAVLDNPDDDRPRFAYADWCEQQPDEPTRARAEFIRAQIAVARMDKASIFRGGHYGPMERAERLQALHGAAWAGPIPDLVDDYGFDRGFIAYIQIGAARFLENAGELFSQAPIQHVDLTGVRDAGDRLFHSPYFSRLRSIRMDSCGLYDIHAQMLSASPDAANLGWLSLRNNNIGMAGVEAMAVSPFLKQLRYADLQWNQVNPNEQLAMESGMPVDSWMPEPGQELESRHGYLRWLHQDDAGNRFRIAHLPS